MDSPVALLEMDMEENSFYLGSFVSTPLNTSLFIVSCNLDGNTSIVYKCVDRDNRVCALKTIRERFCFSELYLSRRLDFRWLYPKDSALEVEFNFRHLKSSYLGLFEGSKTFSTTFFGCKSEY